MNILSRYAHLIELDGRHYLFNVAEGCTVALNKRLADLIETNRNDIDAIKTIHPDLYNGLQQCDTIVDGNSDESAKMIAQFETRDNDPSVFGMIINPTLDCNLRCWYCYETHGKGTMMSAEVIKSVKRLIDRKLSNPQLKKLNISFFGGEPLLGWDKVVMPILTYAAARCTELGVALKSAFTTNGVLLSESRYNDLIRLGLGDTSFQISIDGNKTLHDNSRVNAAKHPTYERIMANVFMGATKGFTITLRFKYTPENIETYTDVLNDLEAIPADCRKNILCSFHQIWQTVDRQNYNEIYDESDKVSVFFRENGFATGSDRKYYRHVCYGDQSNKAVINYNGDLYKCTAREFSPETREGYLTPDGDLIWNERYKQRMTVKYADPVCRQCRIMPICNGGCSQNKLERRIGSGCPMGRDNNAKQEYLCMALKQILYK